MTTLLTPYTHSDRWDTPPPSVYALIHHAVGAVSSRISPVVADPVTMQPTSRALSGEERALLDISFGYRLLYFFKVFPTRSLLAWKGACWCSTEKLDAFPYGPGPDDPSLSASAIRRFFEKHESFLAWISPPGKRLALADERQLNRHCLILGLLETVVRKGLFNCQGLPLFDRTRGRILDLRSIAEESLVAEMTRMSFRFRSDFWEDEIDIESCLEERRRIPATSPLLTAR